MSSIAPAPPDDGRPLLVVWGNCQAESLRLLLDDGDLRSVRLPAVHELEPYDVPALQALLRRTDLLVAQPVADGYHGLPIGTAQLVELLPPGARHQVVPIVRWSGLHPLHVVVHPPGLPDPVPPVVAYHDVAVATAAAWRAAGTAQPAEATGSLTAQAVRGVGERSLAELRRREAGLGVHCSDLLLGHGFAAMRTINHPGNAVLTPLAARVRAALGLPPRPPGVTRPLLDAVHAPRLREVAAVHDPDADPRPDWLIDGREVSVETVAAAHTAFYDARPDVLAEVLRRSSPERELLGLRTPEELR